ncbi:hypothetical protein MKY88_17430 [Lysinibacillus sp. FSL R7-0073]|uniref:hypothetical protein n=1 Tax=Lysinibacillus sp. FSL R7-0073 TaxID=2921669 RepID=UPI0030F4E219
MDVEQKLTQSVSNQEILRQQLELLAERSANDASVSDLPLLTLAMVELYKQLESNIPSII